MNVRKALFFVWFFLVILVVGVAFEQPAQMRVVALESSAPLITLKMMVMGGSAQDPAGQEGLAYLTARMLIEGGFGDPQNPVTKERLAEITRPWGSGAYPSVNVSKETTTFSMTIPAEVLDEYLAKILGPMFTQPLFLEKELERLAAETLQQLQSLRLEQIELVGLVALDSLIHDGTSYAHPDFGTETGLKAVHPESVRRFYRTYYRPENVVLGLNRRDPTVVDKVRRALAGMGRIQVAPLPTVSVEPPPPVHGRQVLILALPNAISTGLHAGFPIPVTRKDPDYWPLYVANIWFGTHRDSFSHLYQVIRAARGYNYGDYSYIEHFEGRPFYLFPPTNTPRRYQYFSIWIRPVGHRYAVHLMKALTWELEHFIDTGLDEEQCEMAKNKARVLYLNLAETGERLLGYRLDDAFYGMEPGYLEGYLKNIDAVTCDAVNAAIRKYLQVENIKYLVVTDDEMAPKIADAIAADRPVWGKRPEDYQIDVRKEDGQKVYIVPEAKLKLLQRDAVWAYYPLRIPRDRIRIVPAQQMFVTAGVPKKTP